MTIWRSPQTGSPVLLSPTEPRCCHWTPARIARPPPVEEVSPNSGNAWIQTATFLVAGALALWRALGVWKVCWTTSPRVVAGPIGLFWWSIGLIGAGLFTTDPVVGYPPGVTVRPEYSTSGALHDLFSVPAFIAIGLAIGLSFSRWFLRRRAAMWAAYSAASGVIILGAFFAAATSFSSPTVLTPYGGALQRVTAVTIWAWFTAICIYLRRRGS
jgi:Protein of unknown function (DUF998)